MGVRLWHGLALLATVTAAASGTRLWLVTAASSVALLVTVGAARPGQEELDVPQFPTGVELVTVDVVVTDREGAPVSGLSPTDFTLFENGVPQTLATFEAIQLPERRAVAPSRRTVVSTNVRAEAEAAARPGRWFGLVLDNLHLELREADYARRAAAAFLEGAVREGDRVTLVTTSGSVWVSTPKEARRDELLVTLEGVEAREPQAGGWVSLYEGQARTSQTLEVLERLLGPLEGTRQPGALILLSGGFFYDSTLDGFGRVLKASRLSNIPLHFVDCRGLVGFPAHFAADRGATSADPATLFEADQVERFYGASGSDHLALDSGGVRVGDTNNPFAALQRIADASRVYYLLGYHPTNTSRDGSFRELEVEVNRPNLDVRARKGYRAPLEGETRAAEEIVSEDAWFQTALDSPLDLRDVPLRLAAYIFEETRPGKARVVLVTEVDVRDLAFEAEDGRAVDTLDVLLIVGQPGTGEGVRHDLDADLRLRPETRKELEASGFPVPCELELPPGPFLARLAVRDRNNGLVGSLAHRFEVPELDGLRASSVVLTDALDTVPDSTISQREPRIVAHRTFPTGATLFVRYDVYGATTDPETGQPRVRSGLEIRRSDGAVLGKGEPAPLPLSPGERLTRTSEIRLGRFEAGDYALVLTVLDEVAGQTLLIREEFTLAAPSPSSEGAGPG